MIIVCCFHDTKGAGLEHYLASKLDLRAVGVGGQCKLLSVGLWCHRGFL